MKKKLYIAFVVVVIAVITGILYKYQRNVSEKESKTYTLLPRKGTDTQTQEWQHTQTRANEYLQSLEINPTDAEASLKLAALFIQEARETGNHQYYDQAAMKYVENVLKTDPSNFNALVYKSLICMSQHHFGDGLAVARAAQAVNPHNAYIYGLMVDGYVEMGQYDSAVIHADKMVSIRPDLSSYSRISYLREIFGNYNTAIDAMQMAVEAGGRGDENTEWARTQLASLHEKTGDYKTAEGLYHISLLLRPDYPYALMGMARVAVAKKDYSEAIRLYQKADSLIEDNSIKEELADVYRTTGDKKMATKIEQAIVDNLQASSTQAVVDEGMGHYADRELAYAYLKLNDTDKALEHAMLEYNRRPANIDVNETVAWVYYNKGQYKKALPYIKEALKTNSKNPVLLSRAGLIYFKAGDKQLAQQILHEASASTKYIGAVLRAQTESALQNM